MQSLRRIFLLAMLFALVGASPASAVSLYTADLSPANEVPPVESNAIGSFELLLDDTDSAYTWTMTLNAIEFPLLFSHIHMGTMDMNGGVIEELWNVTGIGAVITGENIIFGGAGNNATVIAELIANRGGAESMLYVNVHSQEFQGGEVRGQLQFIPEPSTALLLAFGLTGLAAAGRRNRR